MSKSELLGYIVGGSVGLLIGPLLGIILANLVFHIENLWDKTMREIKSKISFRRGKKQYDDYLKTGVTPKRPNRIFLELYFLQLKAAQPTNQAL